MIDVTLSYLRSKEFQRIHLPCIPLYGDTAKCTPVYIEVYPGKVVTLQKSKPLLSKKQNLDVGEVLWYRPILAILQVGKY